MSVVLHFFTDHTPKWMNDEPEMKLLDLIKYIDSEGNDKEFRLISSIQGEDCERLGIRLDITIAGFGVAQCKKILDQWIIRGDGEYSVTWGGLLLALKDAQLGGIANHLRKALTLANE